MLGRELTPKEAGQSELETLLSATHWALRKIRVYVETGTTTVYLPDAAYVSVVKDPQVHMTIKAKLIELAVYQVKFMVGKDSWLLGAEILA